MASPPFSIAETLPGDTDIASQFPALERTFRDVVESWLLVDHNTSGQHKYVEFADQGASPTFASGIIGVWNEIGVLSARLANGTIKRVVLFPVNTTTIFAQAAPPAGWSLSVAHHDQLLRVVNTSGGGQGGDWTVSGLTTQDHTLTEAEMPLHNHSFDWRTAASSAFTGPGGNGWGGDTPSTTGGKGGSQPHNHGAVQSTGAWRPAYTDVVIGVLQ